MLEEESIQIIRDSQSQSIAAKQLIDEQLSLIYTHNWFNIWVPKAYGGLEYSLEEGLRLLEELAYYDGSLAWTITLCSGANMFAGYIDPIQAEQLFAMPTTCFGGSGQVAGQAVWDGEFYQVSGTWKYATGAPHLSHFTLNAAVFDQDKPRLNKDGTAVVYSFFVPKEEVIIHYDWDTFGLESTASHSFTLQNSKLRPESSFILSPTNRHFDHPLYRIPFLLFASLTLVVNYMGMYRRFVRLAEKYFFNKSKDPHWADQYSKARFKLIDSYQQKVAANNQFIKETTDYVWEQAMKGTINPEDPVISDATLVSKQIVNTIRTDISTLMPLLGIHAAQRENEINIVFRNIFTATQHSLLNIP